MTSTSLRKSALFVEYLYDELLGLGVHILEQT